MLRVLRLTLPLAIGATAYGSVAVASSYPTSSPHSTRSTTAAAARAVRSRPQLVEDPSCGSPRATPPSPVVAPVVAASGGSSQSGVQTITVTIPATSFLRLDRSGGVVSAATNTRCAPRADDNVCVFYADGTVDKRSDFDVTKVEWRGDFTRIGVYQLQR